jgi:hypothetical protein
MAIVGHAEIVVRAITKNFEKELKDAVGGIDSNLAKNAGRKLGDGFSAGFARSNATGMFGKMADGLQNIAGEAEAARERFQSLMRVGYTLQGVLGLLAGGISSVVVSMGPLIGSLTLAIPAATALATAFVSLQIAIRVGKSAFGDIAAAVQNSTKANTAYGDSAEEAAEKLQQLRFEAEGAVLSQDRAAIALEKARERFIRSQEFPENSRERREAELAFREADLAYRRAKDRNNDLKKELKDGPKPDRSGAGADPFANLNAAQKDFAQFLISLKPRFDRLELSLSNAFLPPLREAVNILMREIMPILETQLPGIAESAGNAMKNIAIAASTPTNAAKLQNILKAVSPNVEKIGKIFENLLSIILSILQGSEGITTEFLTWLQTLTGNWATNLDVMGKNGTLREFFRKAGEEAAKWGTVIGNIFGGLINLMNLTTGPGSAGEEMLNWFTEASESFKNMFAEDPEAGKKFFKDAMVNARAVLGSIGALIGEILALADNPNIAVAFDTLAKGAPSIGNMLEQMINAGPSFANLILTITKILESLTDDGQLEGFFDTLNAGAQKVLEVVQSPAFKAIMDNIGPIIGMLSAIGLLFDIARFAFMTLVGYFLFMSEPLKSLRTSLAAMGGGGKGGLLGGLGKALKAGGIIGLIVLLIGKAVEFYNRFEDFKTMVDNVMANVGEAFGEFFDQIGILFENLFGGDGIGGIMTALDPVIKFLLEFFIPIAGFIIERFVNAFTFIISVINTFVSPIMAIVKGLVEGIILLFTDFPKGLGKILTSVVTIFVGIFEIIANLVVDLVNWVLGGMENLVRTIGNTPLGKAIADATGINLSGVTLVRLEKVAWVKDAMAAANKSLGISGGPVADRRRADGTIKLATGGTVYPRPGGVMATIAEAGRPERVEPLDPSGLSQRDRALISELAPGGGMTINVYPSPGMDEKELVNLVSRKIAAQVGRGRV